MATYKLPVITGTSLSVGDILRWNGSNWVNYADSNYSGVLWIRTDTTLSPAIANDNVDIGSGVLTTGRITLPDTTTSTAGIINKDNIRFLHNFHHPTGDTHVPYGRNIFLGKYAGNFTVGSGATANVEGSDNIGVGHYALTALTSGFNNAAFGSFALYSTTSGYRNMAIGGGAGQYTTTGYENAFIGCTAGIYNTSGYRNVAIGQSALSAIAEKTVHRSVYIGAYTAASKTWKYQYFTG